MVFLAFVMLSAMWVLVPESVGWRSPFPCCFLFEVGIYNLVFGLLMEKCPAPSLWKGMASWLALATLFLPMGLFFLNMMDWKIGAVLVPVGIWGGLTSVGIFLVWPPRLSG